ncbi:MAG: DUF262 domain-containing protein [Spirochaetales bacterium]|nr:DUF262 domain-containing protein [Spirochaetales bacterium]
MDLSEKKKLDTVSIPELCGNSFFIPDYQRGYRWTKDEITYLLKDLKEFFTKTSEGFYCLQPLVVAKRCDNSWEVIDGQQRLTTINLILQYASNIAQKYKDVGIPVPFSVDEPYDIDYQTREGSKEYLRNRDEKDKASNIDFFHIYEAYEAIKHFFEENNKYINDFFTAFLDNNKVRIRFIWYNVSEDLKNNSALTAEDIFTRLNIGKIGLTNAELLKALFINRVDLELNVQPFQFDESYSPDRKRNLSAQFAIPVKDRIANNWDEIEKCLNEPDFWAFIYGKDDGKYATRIEFLFDILTKKTSEDNSYYTFNEYSEYFKKFDDEFFEILPKLKSSSLEQKEKEIEVRKFLDKTREFTIEHEWKKVCDLYDKFRSWYSNEKIYNLIGFLRYLDVDIETINKWEKQEEIETHDDFIELLKREVCTRALTDPNEKKSDDDEPTVYDIKDISYESDYRLLVRALLLSNVMFVQNLKRPIRFSYKDFYNEKWDVEHVASQTEMDSEGKDRKSWIITTLEYFSGVIIEITENKNSKGKLVKKENLAKFREKIQQKIDSNKLDDNISDDYTIRKLCEELLDLLTHKDISLINSPVYNEITKVIFKTKMHEIESKNSISNLVLLDQRTNRGYHNALFPVKCRWIKERESEIFIMPCTKNVFMKVYSKQKIDQMNWNKEDADDYMQELERICQN